MKRLIRGWTPRDKSSCFSCAKHIRKEKGGEVGSPEAEKPFDKKGNRGGEKALFRGKLKQHKGRPSQRWLPHQTKGRKSKDGDGGETFEIRASKKGSRGKSMTAE